MDTVHRKVTYRLYPSAKQANRMQEMLRLHQRLYNAALEQRIDAYQRCGVGLSFAAQCRELTNLRAEMGEYRDLNAQSQQVTLKRLDRAYKNFFRRVAAGEQKVGFPRFKSADRFKGWGYKSHGDGWRFRSGEAFINGTLQVSGVGNLQARGRARFADKGRTTRNPGLAKTMEVLRKNGHWYASITFETFPPYRACGHVAVGVDWGLTTFATVVGEDGSVASVDNPRHHRKASVRLKESQRSLSRKRQGSRNRAKAKQILLRRHTRVAWQRENFLHQTSAALIRSSRLVATEALNVVGMTANGGTRKTGLNRSVLDTSPGKFLELLAYKAAEAGIAYIEVPTRKIKPTQTCSSCGEHVSKGLSQRRHTCHACGYDADRDENAARVILHYALTGVVTGREPTSGVEGGVARPMKHETSPIPERACQGA